MFNSKTKRVQCAIAAVAMLCQATAAAAESACILPDEAFSSATSASGILVACPNGDGDQLSDKGLAITVTLKSCFVPMPGVAATDIWVQGCSNGLLLCSQGQPFVSGVSNNEGVIVLDGRLFAGGCDNTGLRVVAQGSPITSCVPIQTRTMDLKSSGAPGPPPCGGDQLCPDGVINIADFAHFSTHYPTGQRPAPAYFACLDFAAPYSPESAIGLADYSKFVVHFSNGHHCL